MSGEVSISSHRVASTIGRLAEPASMPASYDSIFRPSLFRAKVALVTGGGSGLGRCVAHELASLGAHVVIAGRRRERLDSVAAEIRALGGSVDACVMNIRSSDEVRKAVAHIVASHGRIDLLVNNAGGQFAAPASTFTDNGWRSVIDLNLNGTWNVTKAVFDASMAAYGGSVVCVVADYFTGYTAAAMFTSNACPSMPFMAHTGAARAGVDNMVKSLAIEWGQHGIRINSAAPGTIIGSGMSNYSAEMVQQISETYSWQNPSGRLGTEAEVSSAVCFLLSPAASYINGHCLRVDGASSLRKGMMVDDYFSNSSKIAPFIGLPDSAPTHAPKQILELLDKYKMIEKAKL